MLLALVDADCNFIAVDVGCNGRSSDGGVLKDSPIGKVIGSEEVNWPPPGKLPGCAGMLPYFIVGDDAFPLQLNIMKPYSHRGLERSEMIYNYRISRARRVSENAFGLLAARFRIFLRTIDLEVESIDKVVLCCCVLHNYLRQHSTARSTYSPANSIDREDIDSGTVHRGSYRAELDSASYDLLALGQQGSGNYTRTAGEVRDSLHDYVNSDAGKVSWQDRMI